MDFASGDYIWDVAKERMNRLKHGVDFFAAAKAFEDPARKIFHDEQHSASEARHFCIGKVDGRILTVRFVYRSGRIRIFGAGYWRKGTQYYAEES